MPSSTCASAFFGHNVNKIVDTPCSSGLPLSTYFSGIKLLWMLDYYPEVKKAHEADELLFGTVESWILYVGARDIIIFVHSRLAVEPHRRGARRFAYL